MIHGFVHLLIQTLIHKIYRKLFARRLEDFLFGTNNGYVYNTLETALVSLSLRRLWIGTAGRPRDTIVQSSTPPRLLYAESRSRDTTVVVTKLRKV